VYFHGQNLIEDEFQASSHFKKSTPSQITYRIGEHISNVHFAIHTIERIFVICQLQSISYIHSKFYYIGFMRFNWETSDSWYLMFVVSVGNGRLITDIIISVSAACDSRIRNTGRR